MPYDICLSLFSSFCLMLSVCLFLNISDTKNSYFNETDASERCALEQLNELRTKNPKKVMLDHLNINSIPNKFEGIIDLVANNLDIFLILETRIDNSFPDAEFSYKGYSKPHRKNSRLLKEHVIPNDAEIMCVEINLRKQKWIILVNVLIVIAKNTTELSFLQMNRLKDFVAAIICTISLKKKPALKDHQNVTT